MKTKKYTRRNFVKKSASGIIGITAAGNAMACAHNPLSDTKDSAAENSGLGNGTLNTPGTQSNAGADQLPKRILGNTGMEVSMLSFGGGSQFMKNENGKWEPLLQRALDMGINYFDTCVDYNGSEERFAEILTPIRDQVFITTKFNGKKDNRRNVDVMKQELETSLTRLKTDYLDVYMMHAVDNNDSSTSDLEKVYNEMVKLKEQGVVRNIGFSSMNSAERSRYLIQKFDFDVCMLAINPTTYGNYEEITVPEAIKKNVGVFAMKVMRDIVGKGATAEELMTWGLDREGVAGAVIGHWGQEVMEENYQLVMKYKEASVGERDWGYLERKLQPFAGPHALCWARPEYEDVWRA